MTRLCTVVLGVGLLSGVGCTNSAETVQPDPYALSERALRTATERLSEPAPDSSAAARRAQFAARQMREAGLMPVFSSSFLGYFDPVIGGVEDPARAHVLGYVPGRNPSYANSLVLVATDLDSPAAGAVLETARRLALEALDTQVPERTLLVALWGPPRTGTVGLKDYLAHPTWAPEGIARVLLVMADTSESVQSHALLATRGIEPEHIGISPLQTNSASEDTEAALNTFAEALYVRVRSVALVPDTLAVPTEGLDSR